MMTNSRCNFTGHRLLSIATHLGVVIFHNKTIQRSDFYIIGAAFFLYFLSPIWLTIRLARFVFAVAIAIIPNALVCQVLTDHFFVPLFIPSFPPCTDSFPRLQGIELDFTVIMLIIELVFEFWLRTMPVYWTFTAAYSIPVFTFSILVGLGFILEMNVELQPSSLIQDLNLAGVLPLGAAIVLMVFDFVGSLLTMSTLVHWTLPLTWIITLAAVTFIILSALYDRAWKRTVVAFLAAIIGYILSPYLPTKLVAFLIALECHVALASAVRSIDVAVCITEKINAKPSTFYWIGVLIAIIFDLVSSHYTSLGGQFWIRLGGVLAAQSVLLLPFAVFLPTFVATTLHLQKAESEKQEEGQEKKEKNKKKQ